MADKKDIDWKSSIITLIPAILSNVTLIITALGTFFSDVYNKPNLQVSILPIEQDEISRTSVDVFNDGRVPATNLKLFIRSPENILTYDNFTTENITVSKLGPKLLRVDVPRLVQGGGSMVNTVLTTDTNSNASNQSMIVHAIFDQGSLTRVSMSEPAFVDKLILDLTSFFGNPLVSILIGIITLSGTLFMYRNYKHRRSRYILERLIIKLNMIVENNIGNESLMLKKLYELQSGAVHSFSRRKLFESHFNTFMEQYQAMVRNFIIIHYVVLAGKDISIFGFSFGNIAGVVLIDNQKSEIGYWSDTRIDIKYSGIINEESRLTVIANSGILIAEQLNKLAILRPH